MGVHAMADPTGRNTQPSSTSTTNEPRIENAFNLDAAQIANNLEPFFAAGSRLIENWRKASEELLEFGNIRLSRNMETGRKVARSANLQEAMEVQSEHARSMMQDYMAETGKLVEIGNRAIAETFSVWRVERLLPTERTRTQEAAPQTAESGLSRKFAAE